MATSSGDSSILEEELTCPVCLDLFRDPHMLPCGHNFCMSCLQKLKTRSDNGRLRCPECRQSHRSSTNWQRNFKLANIADSFRRQCLTERSIHSLSGPSLNPTVVSCDYCPANSAENDLKAVKTCLKCEVSMCTKHIQPHLELLAFREHPLVGPLSDMKKRKCTEHDEMFKFYCVDERQFLCNACTIKGTHIGHSIKTLKNTMKDFKIHLDIQLHKVNRKIVRAEKNQQEQKEIEQENKTYLDESKQHLDSFREASIAHLDASLAYLRECIHNYDDKQNREVQQNLTRISQDHTRLQEVHSGLEILLQENDPYQLIKDYNSSAKRYRRMIKKPLFLPDHPPDDTYPMYEVMEAKMALFLEELRQQTNTLISTVCERKSLLLPLSGYLEGDDDDDGGGGGDDDGGDDDGDDGDDGGGDDDDGEEEEEEEVNEDDDENFEIDVSGSEFEEDMRSEEADEQDHSTGQESENDDAYTPEEDEDEREN